MATVTNSRTAEWITPDVGETFNIVPPVSWDSTQSMDGADRLNLWPVYVPVAMTISATSIYVRSAASAGAWRMGWYALDGTGGVPYTLLGDCGTIDPTGSTGTKTASASVVLPQGWVAFGLCHQSSSSGGTYARGLPSANAIRTITSPTHVGWSKNSVTGAFSSISSGLAGVAGYAVPAIMVARSA